MNTDLQVESDSVSLNNLIVTLFYLQPNEVKLIHVKGNLDSYIFRYTNGDVYNKRIGENNFKLDLVLNYEVDGSEKLLEALKIYKMLNEYIDTPFNIPIEVNYKTKELHDSLLTLVRNGSLDFTSIHVKSKISRTIIDFIEWGYNKEKGLLEDRYNTIRGEVEELLKS